MEKEKKKMGRPTVNPRTNRIQIRIANDELNILNECSEKMKITRTDVIVKGIQMVKKELENIKK